MQQEKELFIRTYRLPEFSNEFSLSWSTEQDCYVARAGQGITGLGHTEASAIENCSRHLKEWMTAWAKPQSPNVWLQKARSIPVLVVTSAILAVSFVALAVKALR